MTKHSPDRSSAPTRTIIVSPPRSSDGVGNALSRAYRRREPRLPAEWVSLLDQLDRVH